MDFKKLSFGLGVFSIALGAAELLGARRIASSLESPESTTLIKAYGARELFAGASLLAAPAVSTNMWSRVGGDFMDVGALTYIAASRPGNKVVWGAIAFVLGALALDIFVARGLDQQTGKMRPDAAGRDADTTGGNASHSNELMGDAA